MIDVMCRLVTAGSQSQDEERGKKAVHSSNIKKGPTHVTGGALCTHRY
jgi:hypothetical protein